MLKCFTNVIFHFALRFILNCVLLVKTHYIIIYERYIKVLDFWFLIVLNARVNLGIYNNLFNWSLCFEQVAVTESLRYCEIINLQQVCLSKLERVESR